MLTKKNFNQAKEEGFTLVELLVVIVIIGVIAAIALPIFSEQQKKSLKAGMKSDVRTLNAAVQTYLVKNPNATGMSFARDGSKTPSGTLATTPLFTAVSASDSNGKLRLRGMTTANAIGAWNGYVIIGYFDDLDSVRWTYTYNSQTGQFVDSEM
jgi:type IV pilus assembly protein PilA